MGRFIREAIKILPLGLLLPVIIGAASVSPDDASSNLSKWAHWLGIEDVPQWLTQKASDRWVLVGSIVFALLYLFVIYVLIPRFRHRRVAKPRLFGRRVNDFEKVENWTVSFRFGPFVGAFGSDISYIGIQQCRFTNVSTTQRRVLDLSLSAPTNDPTMPRVFLTTEAGGRPYTERLEAIGLAKEGRIFGTLGNPIELEPSAVLEGEVEFELHSDIAQRCARKGLTWINFRKGRITVHEHRSGRHMTIKAGEAYDAATGRLIPPNRPSWLASFRQAWRSTPLG